MAYTGAEISQARGELPKNLRHWEFARTAAQILGGITDIDERPIDSDPTAERLLGDGLRAGYSRGGIASPPTPAMPAE
jgi:hypothetical protein